MRVDRVVTSSAGQIVTTEPTIVLQALDPSIIKTIDVQEGERVKRGQLLATLDPTFAAADVGAAQSQVASLNAQIARARRSWRIAASTRPRQRPGGRLHGAAARILPAAQGAVRRADARLQRADRAEQGDDRQAQERPRPLWRPRQVSQEIENMRATLAAAQVGSRLNLLAATDQRLEMLRALEFDRNGLTEAEHQLDSTIATRDAFVQQWAGQVSQELVTARNARHRAPAAGQGDQAPGSGAPRGAGRRGRLENGEAVRRLGAEGGRSVDHSRAAAFAGRGRGPHRDARNRLYPPGDRATVKLDAFSFVEHGTAEGTVRWISEGAFTHDDNGSAVDPYYKVRIALTEVKLNACPTVSA